MEKRRVVITGMGVVAPNGLGVENFWDSLVHGLSAVKRITRFDASSYPSQIAAEVVDFEPSDYMDPKTQKRCSRFAQFTLAASREAERDAKMDISSEDPYKVGIFVGTDIGAGDISEIQNIIFMEKGIRRISPFTFTTRSAHSAAAIIGFEYGLKGPNATIGSGSNSGLDAIYLATRVIEYGDADVMFVGAGEAPITPFTVATCCASGFLSRENMNPECAMKPYDIRADGTVLGEGGGLVILEEFQHAMKRKAKLYGEVLGCSSVNAPFGWGGDVNYQDVLAAAIEQCLMKASLNKEDIGYISTHGNGVLNDDLKETVAIKRAFGEFAYQIPVSSFMPVTGYSLSVTGILQLITCLLVMNSGVIPPTINHYSPHPLCDLNYVPNHYTKAKVKNALVNTRGFAGNQSILIVGALH